MATIAEVLQRVRQVVLEELKPRVIDIDVHGAYPEAVLRALGEAGLFGLPLLDPDGNAVGPGIDGIVLVGEQCASTAFLCWCQMVCALYVHRSENVPLRARLLSGLVAGTLLGGTALSNPMKALAGIEPMRLHARRGDGGYHVSGHVPFVSNMGPGHWFAGMFRAEERLVMAMFQCGEMEGLAGSQTVHFCAMDGTRTFSLALRDVFVPDELVIADPAEPHLVRVVPGFVLLQTGIALGLVRDCLEIVRGADQSRQHVNRFLPDGHDRIAADLWTLEIELSKLTAPRHHDAATSMPRVLQARLDAAELALRAAQAAMLHTGAAGYVRTARAQRRVREAQFIAILTPALRHLRWELDAITSGGGTMRRLTTAVASLRAR